MSIARISIAAAGLAGVTSLAGGVLTGLAPDAPKDWAASPSAVMPTERLTAMGITMGGGLTALTMSLSAPGRSLKPMGGTLGALLGGFLIGQAIGTAVRSR